MPKAKANPAARPAPNSASSASAADGASRGISGGRNDRQAAAAGPYPAVPAGWLLQAAALAVGASVLCLWLSLCLLYWQGAWQLLYHPKPAVTQTPRSAGMAYDFVAFAATETGRNQLAGWWIPAQPGNRARRFTVLYLHGAEGNLSDTLPALAALHDAGLDIFAFDYRGYGESLPLRPSEPSLRQDAAWAIGYLTQTRHIPAGQIVLYGDGLGANLAVEVGAQFTTWGERPQIATSMVLPAAYPTLAGIILANPQTDPTAPIFNDPRSRLVPAHWLIGDRYDLAKAAKSLKIPSLWLIAQPPQGEPAPTPSAYALAPAGKTAVALQSPLEADPHFQPELKRWLDDLPPAR